MTKIPFHISDSFHAEMKTNSKGNSSDQSKDFMAILDQQKDTQKKMDIHSGDYKDKSFDQKSSSTKKDKFEDEDFQKRKRTENQDENTFRLMNEFFSQMITGNDVTNAGMELQNIDAQALDSLKEISPSAMQEWMNGAASQLEENIMNRMNLTPDALQDILSELGLELDDLLNESALTQFVLASAGASDPSEFLTNEELLQTNQLLQDDLKDIKNVLGIQIMQEAVTGSEDDSKNGLKNVFDDLTEFKNTKVVESSDIADLSLDIKNGNNQDLFKNDSSDERSSEEDKITSVENSHSFMNISGSDQFAPDQVAMQGETNTEHVGYSDYQDDVMNQVTEQIKFQMKADATEVNLKLQPETLGTIQIQISAKEGIMTAHFTATSEEVKAILETQLEILQQNLESQDIKVEAIEVSVQPEMYGNEFAQSQEGKQQNESSSGRKRSIVIDDLMSDTTDLTEEEKLVAEMMVANGTTVDYQA